MVMSYVICKKCGEKINVRRPSGRTQLNNVKTNGVDIEGGKISFKPGGSISFGSGGSMSFGPPPEKIRVRCPYCDSEDEYSLSEILD